MSWKNLSIIILVYIIIIHNWPEPVKDFETRMTHELLKEKTKYKTEYNIFNFRYIFTCVGHILEEKIELC